ncbi:putative ribonuclease H-like domain-containing protein [Tanacetum coccineum]
MLVQVYVDGIIFGSTKKSMCTEFEDCMHKRFQMSSMGELTFFLGLQVKQQPDGIFISQDKYVADILKKFDFWSIKTATTPIESNKPLVKDEDGEDVDVQLLDFKDSPFELEAFLDSDYGGASLDRKSTTGGCHNFLGRRIEYLGNARKDYCMKILTTRQNMLQLLTVVGKDSYEKILKKLSRFHTDSTCFADLLTKRIDATRFNLLVETAILSTTKEGLQAISATIDGHEKLITEASLRRHLKLEDEEGISSLSNEEIFKQLAHMGYVTNSESLTFFKGHFSP